MKLEFKNFKRILDVGGGHNALELATDVIDWRIEQKNNGRSYYNVDVCSEPLPFKDHEIDFIYCRQTLEDLHNPVFALNEFKRVAKSGYIETPDVITELMNGVQSNEYRGWAHHHWFVWSIDDTIKLLPKSSAINSLRFDDDMISELKEKVNFESKINNHYFVWQGDFKIKVYRNGIDFDFVQDYDRMIRLAIEESINYRTVVQLI